MGELYMTIMTSCNIVYTLLTDTFDTKSPLIDEIGLMIVFINIYMTGKLTLKIWTSQDVPSTK